MGSRLIDSKQWPFERFSESLASLLGRKGGLCSFSTQELETLRAIHARHPSLTRMRLKQAVELAGEKTLAAVVWQLQQNPISEEQ